MFVLNSRSHVSRRAAAEETHPWISRKDCVVSGAGLFQSRLALTQGWKLSKALIFLA